MSRLQATGYVIHRRPYRETSLLVDFFTRQYGRISAVAKGARGNNKSDRKSLIQPLQLLSFELSGRTQLKNLGLAEALQSAWQLKGSCFYSAFYMNELLVRALPETEPASLLFEQYQQCLQQLSEISNASVEQAHSLERIEICLRSFELMLLQELGYLPDFSHDAETAKPIQADGFYTFIAEQGFISCPALQPYVLKGEDLLAIDARHFSKSARKTAKFICRQALLPIIGDKPLKSRELFIQS
uniref:DNA repair protein RecO n=1 Tax=Ningiella ruwaisensis TaxID=2364274 RepID=UPI00109FD29A|nr:DNA repair protein RecO [Ningiella ruwaisensis]